MKKLFEGIASNNHNSISKSISIIENNYDGNEQLIDFIFNNIKNKAHCIGITGPPGAGKSTICNKLIEFFRSRKMSIGLLCVDPSSPFTKGAVLGDRIRIKNSFNDKKIFLRSFANRGYPGGISSAVFNACNILDVAGYDIIIIETIGVGQIEIDIVNYSDTVILSLVPESGDEIQILKAGIIEIADIFAINKSDRPGADKIKTKLNSFIQINNSKNDWIPKVINTIATQNDGILDLGETILSHKKFLITKNIDKRTKAYLKQVKSLIINESQEYFNEKLINSYIDKYKKINKSFPSPNMIAKKILDQWIVKP